MGTVHTARGRPRRCVVTAAGAAGAALALAAGSGCSSSGSGAGAGARPAPVVTPVLLRSTDLLLPLDAYLVPVADLDRIGQARRVLIHGCMQRLGYSYPPLVTSPPAGPSTWNERRYGVADPAMAARYGYGLGARDPATHPARPDETGANAPTTAQVHALDGTASKANGVPVPSGGCTGQANQQLTGTASPTELDVPQQLSAAGFNQSSRDPAVVRATAAWSRCMKTSGYTYASPLDPPGDPRWGGSPLSSQIAAATADVACKRRTNLVGVWFTVESAYERRLIADNRSVLSRVRAANAAQIATAGRLVGA
jgi:hypothetical protein